MHVSSGDQMHCEVKKVDGTTLPPYWDWVQRAHYMGKKEFKNMTYDIWEAHVSNHILNGAWAL